MLGSLDAVIEALLRVVVGLALVPHGLRVTFGFFRGTGLSAGNLKMLVEQLDRDGYRPGKLWAPLISATELIAGPLLALGLFTRLAAIPIVIFMLVTCRERWVKGAGSGTRRGSSTP
jgi:putative oxidoreductase